MILGQKQPFLAIFSKCVTFVLHFWPLSHFFSLFNVKKKYRYLIIILVVILAFCISICFIPINATKFIPVIEKQVAKDLGINIHIERLILRLGPSLKVKTPMMHIMYEDDT